MQETTIAAIVTAPGAGGIAVAALGAEVPAAWVFRPANAAKKVEDASYTAMYGTFRATKP